MSMLAEPRRKKKQDFPLLGCGKPYFDKDGFGAKMLKQMGWQEGRGLGKTLQGLAAPIRPKYNLTRKGFSARNEKCVDYIDHQKRFNDLLADLNSENQETCSETVSMSSLEERSKKSRRHIHYHKFTQGKDVSKYSLKDFEGIMGKKVTQDTLTVLNTPCSSDISCEEHVLSSEVCSVGIETELGKRERKKKRNRTHDGVGNENAGAENKEKSIRTGRKTSCAIDNKKHCGDEVQTTIDSPKKKKKKCIYGNIAMEYENGYLFHKSSEKTEEEHEQVHLMDSFGSDSFRNDDEICTVPELEKRKTHSIEIFGRNLRDVEDGNINHTRFEEEEQNSYTKNVSKVETVSAEMCAVQKIKLKEKALDRRTKEEKQKKKILLEENILNNSVTEQNLSFRHDSINEHTATFSPVLNSAMQNKQLNVGANNSGVNQNKHFFSHLDEDIKEKPNEKCHEAYLKNTSVQNVKKKKRKKRNYGLCEADVETTQGKGIPEVAQDLVKSRKTIPTEEDAAFSEEDCVYYASCRNSKNKNQNDSANMVVEHTNLKQCDMTGNGCKKLSEEALYDRICSCFIGANLHNIKGYGNY